MFRSQVLLVEEALCVEAVTLGWELVQGLTTNAHDFWLALKGFICMAFHHELLQLTESQAPTLVATLKQVIQIRPGDLKTKGGFYFQQALSTMSDFYIYVVVLCDSFKIATELMQLSQSKSGVFGVLLQHCCQTWLPTGGGGGDPADSAFTGVFSHVNILAEACVYGPVFRRDQR